ncbi:hypothetical protein BBF96_03080 [Anoxybacter fermentans]|uniref:Uncharacterized protein n=1 Tax=Anoxybacter fermentans TaxID=1323375 RepID=A0A3S9SVZ8_9FIRM|nr:hypothetical protein [Anoxybacter fermentans]AZR72454.1 hypothetical protein BBF96_03080 [Anoxybacter fermentans]
MFRKPYWMRRWRIGFRYRLMRKNLFFKNIFGVFLCLIGLGVILAAIPAWLYLVLFGTGILFSGFVILQKR